MVVKELIRIKIKEFNDEINKRKFLEKIENILFKMVPRDVFVKGLIKEMLFSITLFSIFFAIIMMATKIRFNDVPTITECFFCVVIMTFISIDKVVNHVYIKNIINFKKQKTIADILLFSKNKIKPEEFKELYNTAVKEGWFDLTFDKINGKEKEFNKDKVFEENKIKAQQNEIQKSLLNIFYKSIKV